MNAIQKSVILIASVLALTSCGGGEGETSASQSGPAEPLQPSGGVTSPTVVSSAQPRVDTVKTAGGATLERTFVPGAISFSDDARITIENAQTLILLDIPGVLKQGSVFTWHDHAYVASAVTNRADGAQVISVRDARRNEILNNLTLKGDISLADVDPDRSSFALPVNNGQVLQKGAQISEKAYVLGPCKGVLGFDEPEQSLSCNKTFTLSQIGLNVTAGIRSLKIFGVSIDILRKEYTRKDFAFKPFLSLDASILNESGGTSKIEGDLVIGRAQLVLQNTLGFIQIHAPLAVTYKLPLFRMSLGVEGLAVIEGGAYKTFDLSFKTPISTLGTDKVFSAGIADAFVGIKTGFEVVAVSEPTPVIPPLAFGPGDQADSSATIGSYVKMGGQGLLSAELKTIGSKPCFKYSLKPAIGVSFTLPSDFLKGEITKTLDSPILEDRSGCEDNTGPLTCKLNSDGSGTLTGSVQVSLQPGQDIKLRAWPGRNLTGFVQAGASGEQCSQGNYAPTGPGEPPLPSAAINFGICTPTTGLQTGLDFGTICYNPLKGGVPRNINVIFNGTIPPSVLFGTNTFDLNYCQLTEFYLNSAPPPNGSSPDVISHKLVSCN